MDGDLELIAHARGEITELGSPGVGWFTGAAPQGGVLEPGAHAGWLVTLGVARALRVPAGVSGVVRSKAPERVHEPVGYRHVLYELAPLAAAGARPEAVAAQARSADGALLVRAPQSGRFWHRPAPGEPALAAPGLALAHGSPLGLIEVMKTFTQVVYRSGAGLPERARIRRVLVADGGEVEEGAPIVEIEPA